MNFFSTTLKKELDEIGETRSVLAKRFEISLSNLSEYCSGNEPCGERQVAKIVKHLPTDAAARIVAAWMKDRALAMGLPHDALEIHSNDDCVREEPYNEWPEVDDELRRATQSLLRRSLIHPELREILLSTEAMMVGYSKKK